MAKLDAVLVCVAMLGILFTCLLIFNRSDTLASLVPLATIILGFSFIFGHSAQTLFESVSWSNSFVYHALSSSLVLKQMIFIFSTHVFDVGDLVMIDDQVRYFPYANNLHRTNKYPFSTSLSKNLVYFPLLFVESMAKKLSHRIHCCQAQNSSIICGGQTACGRARH